MNLRLLLIAGICLAGLMLTASNGYAQQRYEPAYPTFPPSFNYFRSGSGLLNNYYGFVQRDRQIESTQKIMRENAQKQQATINDLQGQISEVREAQVGATGKGSSFMNFSHYFGGRSGASPRRAR